MRVPLLATALLLTSLAVVPTDAEARPYPVDCTFGGFGYDWCDLNLVVCDGELRFYHHVPVQELMLDCAGGLSCDVEFQSLVPTHQECDFPPVPPIPPVPASAAERPWPVECITGIFATFCTVDAVVCDAAVVYAHDGSFQSVDVTCDGGLSCGVDLVRFLPTHQECDFPTAASTSASTTAPVDVECQDNLDGTGWCGVHAGRCDVGRGYAGPPSQEKFERWVDVGCRNVADCRIPEDGTIPGTQDCELGIEAGAEPGFPVRCEPTPGNGFGCNGDLGVCTTYSGAESNGISYSGFDCGAVSCDFLFQNGRLKTWDCEPVP